MKEQAAGYMYKTDSGGKLVWSRRVPLQNKVLWQVYDTPGSGFATTGYNYDYGNALQLCFYDDDGVFLSSKAIPVPDMAYISYYNPCLMQGLSNGNFIFAFGNPAYQQAYLAVTNNTFDTLVTRKIDPPPGYSSFFIRGLCEMPDASIALSALCASIGFEGTLQQYWNTAVTRTDLDGNIKSTIVFHDSLHTETPNAVLPFGNEMLMVTGRMGTISEYNGTLVGYYNDPYSELCSGEINLVHLTDSGEFISRQGISDYPSNGMISSARPTSDGGFILCGTVNQLANQSIESITKIYIMKVTASGKFQWSKMFETTYPSYGVDAIESSDGGFFISGHEKSLNRNFNAVVIKTDEDGNV